MISLLPDELKDRPLVLSMSGGKDSVATLLAMREAGLPDPVIVCADTGWEALEWYKWMQRLPVLLGASVRMVSHVVEGLTADEMAAAEEIEAALGISPSAMVRLMLQRALFPSRFMRFCTDELKAKAMQEWLEEQGMDDAVRVTGVRAEESRARAAYPPVEWMRSAKQWHWRPILRWKLADVLAIHQRHGIPLCPLYGRGVSRVGCWPCIPASNKAELRILVETDARRARAIELLEGHVQRLKRLKHGEAVAEWQMFPVQVPGTGRQSSSWAETVQWARTTRGGREADLQLGLWSRQEMSLPCRRMGMCDVGDDGFSC